MQLTYGPFLCGKLFVYVGGELFCCQMPILVFSQADTP